MNSLVKFLMLLLATLMLASSAEAQLIFDARTNTLAGTVGPVPAKSDLWVEVHHFNPYVFNVKIEVDEESFKLEAPSLAQNIQNAIASLQGVPATPSLAGVTLPKKIDIPASYEVDPVIGSNKGKKLVHSNEFLNQYKATIAKVEKANNQYKGALNDVFRSNDCFEIVDDCTWYKQVESALGEIDKLKHSCMVFLSENIGKQDPLLSFATKLLEKLEAGTWASVWATWAKQLEELRSAKKIWDSYRLVLAEIREVETHLLDIVDLNLPNAVPTWLSNTNATKISEYDRRMRMLDSLNMLCIVYSQQHQGLNATFIKVVETIKTNLDNGTIRGIFKNYCQLLLNYDIGNFTFTSVPVRVTGDEVVVSIQLMPRDTVKYPVLHTRNVRRVLPVYNYWQPSFSSGLFVTTISDEQYIQLYDEANDEYMPVSEGSDNVNIGVNALTHYAYKITPEAAFGFHMGAGMVIKDSPSLNVLIGLSSVFGKRNRWAINGGAAIGRRDVKLDNIVLGQLYPAKLEMITKKKTSAGLQFSLSYNFSVSGKE
jgi:hypothetical protein